MNEKSEHQAQSQAEHADEEPDLQNMKISGGGPEGTVSPSQIKIAEGGSGGDKDPAEPD